LTECGEKEAIGDAAFDILEAESNGQDLQGPDSARLELRRRQEFVSMMSHELKNALTPIVAFSDMLNKKIKVGYQLTDNDVKSLQIIRDSGHRMKHQIEDLMSAYKLDMHLRFYFRSVDLVQLIEESVSDFSTLLSERGITVEKAFRLNLGNKDARLSSESETKQQVHLNCDPQKIKEVFANLLTNAIDFVPAGYGKIAIEVEIVSHDALGPSTKLTKNTGSTLLLFSISDNGPGIPDNAVPNIFKKFYQVDPSKARRFGGTGLGLPICKGIIEAHGGSIWYESPASESEMKGACFKFCLPQDSSGNAIASSAI
jgi:signal transduction histidine kinase